MIICNKCSTKLWFVLKYSYVNMNKNNESLSGFVLTKYSHYCSDFLSVVVRVTVLYYSKS